MSTTKPLTYAIVNFWCNGLGFLQALFTILFSAVVFSTWLKWHTLHIIMLCFAVVFFAIPPHIFAARLTCRWHELRAECQVLASKWPRRKRTEQPAPTT